MTALDTARVLRPGNLADAREVMTADTGTLLFRGGGTKLEWGGTPARVDTAVDTRGLDRILAHDAADSTATVQPGVPLSRLQDELAAARQWLALDPPHVMAGATVGGVFATNDAGPRRLRYGTMRDLVIGCTVVLADGAVGRSGGKVIKNVAGYDLAKLLCGSLGTLGLVAELTLRLHPLPQASATVRVPADPGTAGALALELMASPIEPHALDWAEGALWARLQGHPAAVEAQAAAVRRLAADSEVLEGDAEASAWQRLVDAAGGAEEETVTRAGTLPSQLPDAERALREAAAEAGVDAALTSHVALGLHTARLRGGDAAAHAACIEAWRARVGALGGHVVVRRHTPVLEEHADVWGPPPSGIDLMRRVKRQFDPHGRCAPGRFVGGI